MDNCCVRKRTDFVGACMARPLRAIDDRPYIEIVAERHDNSAFSIQHSAFRYGVLHTATSGGTMEYTSLDYKLDMALSLLQQILVLLLRYGQRKNIAYGGVEKKIQEIVRYISDHYAGEITLQSAASLAYMEPTYFSKQFKRIVGFGFNQYLIQVRMKEAKRLLLTTDLSVNEISEKCGYSAGNYFGDAFKSLTGVSPSVYRKTYR